MATFRRPSKRAKRQKNATAKSKPRRTIFVIMPFRKTPQRDEGQLTAYFNEHLKRPIEAGRFKYKYHVRRSDDTFNITKQIILDVQAADIVICDLSGLQSNPNVMYELGMRLSLSNAPVILIREKNSENSRIFDISGFFEHEYDPMNYVPLVAHIRQKLKRLESGEETFESPVLKILESDTPLLAKMSSNRAKQKLIFLRLGLITMLNFLVSSIHRYLRARGIEFNLGKLVSGAIHQIEKRPAEFDKIDFSEFRCRFSSQPMIEAYLADQYLYGIVDFRQYTYFTFMLIDYHIHFFGMDIVSQPWTPGGVRLFVGQTSLLVDLISDLEQSLTGDDKAKQRATDTFLKRIQESPYTVIRVPAGHPQTKSGA